MTVIVVKRMKDKIVMASDSQTTMGNNKSAQSKERMFTDVKKIFLVNDMLIGCAGSVKGNTLMKVFAKSHRPKTATVDDIQEYLAEFEAWAKKKDGTFTLVENHFIMVFDKKIFEICDGILVREVKDYDAIGSGSFLALGALYYDHSPEEAIEVAKEFDLYCSGPTDVHEVSLK